MKHIYIFIVLMADTLFCFGQIRGTIQNIDGEVVSSANVLLLTTDSTFVQGTVSAADGAFCLASQKMGKYLLKITYMGYEDLYINHYFTPETENLGVLVLKQKENLLDQVTVKGNSFHLTGNGIKVLMKNSLLREELSITDVLRKIPGMSVEKGKLIAFASGTPVIYLNNKRISDFNELVGVPVENIVSVELIRNPGPEYKSSHNPVLKIKTQNPDEGFAAFVRLGGEAGHKGSSTDFINLSYQHKSLNLFGSYSFMLNNQKYTDDVYVNLYNKEIMSHQIYYSKYKAHIGNLGFNLDFGKNNTLGMEYTFICVPRLELPLNETVDGIHYRMNSVQQNTSNHINLFYNRKINDKLIFSVLADYLNSPFRNDIENSEGKNENTYIRSSDFSYKAFASYTPTERLLFTLGINGHAIHTKNEQEIQEEASRRISINESMNASFLSMETKGTALSLKTGLRYEHTRIGMEKRDVFLPSITFAYSSGNSSHSLSYSNSIERPSFDNLAGNIYSDSRYAFTVGNISLKPSDKHSLMYSFLNGDFYFTLGYNFYKDFQTQVYLDKGDSYTYTYANHNRRQWLFNGAYEYSKGIWKGMFNLDAAYERFHFYYGNKLYKTKAPEVMLNVTNRFRLLKKYSFSIEYQLTTCHDRLITRTYFSNGFNLRLQRTWLLPNILQVSIFGNDIFNQNRSTAIARYQTVYKKTTSWSDMCRAGFSLSFYFRNYNKKYQGVETISQDRKRLKQ